LSDKEAVRPVQILGARMTGFRNLADLELDFSPGVNLFEGRNGQGKTNLLEALNFPALGRSHRGARAEDLIRHGAPHLHVALEVAEADGHRRSYEFAVDRQGSRRFRIDGELIARRSDLVGRLATIFFWPQSNELVRGGPEHRRRFADQGICGLDPAYLRALSAHQRALRQKSRLLRDLRHRGRDDRAAARELAAWNADLAAHAVPIGRGRGEWATLLQPRADAVHRELTGADEPLIFAYRPRLPVLDPGRGEGRDEAEIRADILAEFDYIGPDEKRRGRPLTGLQFDDFEVRSGEFDLRVYGSQGETRTAALSLILAQSDVVYRRRRVRPVLFLDDIFSELDRQRAQRLQRRCARDHQIFIATARAADVAGWHPQQLCRWRVENGRLTQLS
jgi:DNA replication and repair protein RecF